LDETEKEIDNVMYKRRFSLTNEIKSL